MDIGGQWVVGQDGNAAYDLANPFDLLEKSNTTDLGIEQEFIDSAGNPLNDELSNKMFDFFIKYLFDEEFDQNTTYESVGEFARKMWV